MNSKVTLPIHVLKAFTTLAAKKDPRYYLVGVNVTLRDGQTTIAATDGHILGCYRVDVNDTHAEGDDFDLIIPSGTLGQLKPQKHEKRTVLSFDGVTCSLSSSAGEQLFKPIDGTFPDYLRIVRDAATAKDGPAEFDPKLILRFVEFYRQAKQLGTSKFARAYWTEKGDSAAIVNLDDMPEFFGMMMPWKSGNGSATIPAWATQKPVTV